MRVSIWIILLALLSVNAHAQGEENLVGKWTFNDGTAIDAVTGTSARDVGVSYVPDRFGNKRASAYLHGNHGSYLNLGTDGRLKPAKGTISIWVNIDIPMYGGQGVEGNPVIITKNSKNDDFFEAYSMSYDYNVHKMVASTTLSEERQVTLHSSMIFTIREWHHLVLTYDDNYSCLYIDGNLDLKMAKNFRTVFNPEDSVVVGNMANIKNNRFLCASVDDISIYNRVLSAAEVNELYAAPDFNRFNIYLKWFYRILACVAVAALLIWLLMWRSRKNLRLQQERNKLNARLNELETKAIRTQMNPHFIFNSLNTLQRFILEEDIQSSHQYLKMFSKLLRRLIESSVSDSISLQEELEIIEGYVALEKMRFDNSFHFRISSQVKEPARTFIPFMLIQPFVENAIWHGLLHKEGERNLDITVNEHDGSRLICRIEDNGVGRDNKKDSSDQLKKKSLATDFIRQRLELLRQSTGVDCGFSIEDKKDAEGKGTGTIVTILIPKLNTP